MLIEDNPGDALLIKEALKESLYLNAAIFWAETFNDAIKLSKEDIQLLLLDLNLPDSDGIDTVRNISKFFPDAVIIVLTGLDNDEVSLETLREGAQNYLNKSEITGKVLEKNIRFSLERHQIIKKLWVAEKELTQHKFILEKAQEMAHMGSWLYNFATKDVELSDETYRIFGFQKENFNKKPITFFSMVHEDDKHRVTNTINQCIADKKTYELSHRIYCQDGNIKWVNSQSDIYYDEIGNPIQLIGTIQDITEKKETEIKILNANRLYAFISAINQSIIYIKDEQLLLDEICKIATEIGQFKMAWVAMLDENKILKRKNYSGSPIADGKILGQSIDIDDPILKDFLSVNVIDSGKYFFNNDIQNDPAFAFMKEDLVSHGIFSSIAFPLFKFGKIIGVFGLHSTTKHFFDKDEIKLLLKVLANISFAIELFEQTKKHKEIEIQIKINEQRFRSLIEKNNDMITLSNVNGQLLYGSPSLEKGLGYTLNELTNVKVMDLIHPDDIVSFKEKRKQLLNFRGHSFNSQHRLRHKNGEYIWCDVTLTNMLGETGIDAIVSNFRDISEKKQFEIQLLKSEAFNRGTLNALNSHIAVIDKNGTIIAVNDAWNKFSIENGETVLSRTGVGSNYFEVCEKANLIHEDIALDILQGIKDVLVDKLEIFSFEYPCDSPTIKRWFAARVLKFESDQPMAVIAHLDITDRKQAELERIQITNDLINRNKDLEQFSYIVSHNLRSPVANIIGLTYMAINDEIDEALRLEVMESLSYSVNKLDDVIKDLNHILSTKQNLNEKKELVSFTEIANDVQVSIENIMQIEKATILCDFSEINEIFSIKSYFHSIFYQLISNSIKYHQPNIPPIIKIQSKLNNNKIELHFIDNGMGIDLAKKRDQVFGLYKRFHHNIGGKGMGLFMIKTQIESIGGSINIQSEINKGSTFIIEFNNYN